MQYLSTLPMPLRVGLDALPHPSPSRREGTRWDELRPHTELPLPPPPADRDDPAHYEAPCDDVVITLMI